MSWFTSAAGSLSKGSGISVIPRAAGWGSQESFPIDFQEGWGIGTEDDADTSRKALDAERNPETTSKHLEVDCWGPLFFSGTRYVKQQRTAMYLLCVITTMIFL